MAIGFALLLIVVLLACWALTLLGMPGNWLMVAATAVYAALMPAASPVALRWKLVLALVVLAALGEIVELTAGALGAGKAGGSRRGAVLALVGSMIGAVLGMILGLPIPLVGSMLAALFFAALGAMAGAAVGELGSGKSLDRSWRIARAAFWGRLAGSLGKAILGALMIAVVVAAFVAALTTRLPTS
jgi:uncharacterized protein YqgC (DUF456 family)